MRFRFLIILLFFSLTGLAQTRWSLEKCLNYARENNLSLKQAELDVKLAEIDYKNAKEQVLPAINAGSSAYWNYGLTQNLTTGILENQTVFGNTVRLNADMPLFQGFGLHFNKQLAQSNSWLSKYRFRNKQKEIEINITNAYLQVLMSHEALRAAESQWEAGLAQVKKMKELVSSGVRPQSDLKDMEAQAAQDYFNWIRTKNDLNLSLMHLARLLELDEVKNFDIDTDPDHFPVNEALLLKNAELLFEEHITKMPEYLISVSQKNLLKKQLKFTKSAYYPSVSFFLSWNSRYMNREKIIGMELDPDQPYRVIGMTETTHENVLAPNFRPVTGPPDPYFTQLKNFSGTAFGFSINFPLFNRFQVRRRVQKAEIEVEKADMRIRQQVKELRHRIYQLHADATNAREKERAALKSKEAAEIAYRYAQEKLKAGLISPYELENIKSRKIQAETNYINAKYEYLLKLKLLELTLKSYE